MTAKLVGTDTAPSAGNDAANYAFYNKFTADASGQVSEIKVYCDGNCNVKVAIFFDSSGSPGTMLAANNTGTACVNGRNTITLSSPASITMGQDYWIGVISDAAYITYDSTGGTESQKAATYSTFSFTDNPTGLSSYNVLHGLAGYGTAGLTIVPSGIASTLAFGSPKVNFTLKPSGIAFTAALGSPTLKLFVGPSGIAPTAALGTPTITQGNTIAPSGIASTLAFGTPLLKWNQFITLEGIASALAIGEPAIYQGNITCVGIAPTVAFGTPAVVRFVFHVILEASYEELSQEVNRAFVIGEDSNGADVTGTDHATEESGLVGERLEVEHNSAVTSAAIAAGVAAAILAHARLGSKQGVITIPPHCGLELWDVVSVVDEVANQSTTYRVCGYLMEYDTKNGTYKHEIELCAV